MLRNQNEYAAPVGLKIYFTLLPWAMPTAMLLRPVRAFVNLFQVR